MYNGESYKKEWKDEIDTIKISELTKCGTEYAYANDSEYSGFFSIVSYVEGSLYLSVDLLSEKSLYIYQDNEVVIIGSTIAIVKEAMINIGRNANIRNEKLTEYFMTRHLLQHKNTIWQNIDKVLPGKVHRINLEEGGENKQSIEESAVNIYKYLKNQMDNVDLKESINKYILDALEDTKKGVQSSFIISGGIDSTLVSLMALQELGKNEMETWTLEFGDKDMPARDVAGICERLEIRNHSIKVNQEKYRKATQGLYKYLQYPLPTHSFASYEILVTEVINSGSRILYGGEGADEIYGGYELYKNINKNENNKSYSISPYTRVERKEDLKISTTDVEIMFSTFYNLMKQEDYNDIALRASLLCDIFVQLPSTGLLCADNIGGKHGIESRSPLANIKSIKYTILNREYDISGKINEGKKILASMLEKQLKDNTLVKHKKQGFSGYPNEIFSDEETSENGKLVESAIDLKGLSRDWKTNMAMKWKVNNMGSFIRMMSTQ